jgi:hypothetical protein
MEQFGELNSQCAAIVITLGTPQDSKQLVRRLRQQGATLGRRMQKVGRANLKHPTSKNPVDPDVPRTITEEDFFRELRKCVWDCLAQLSDSKTMDPHQRLALLRRRLWTRGRRLELISKACVVDRAELLRIIAEGERSLSGASSK